MREKLSHHEFATRLAVSVVAVVAFLTFGIILLATGDWIPGGIIVVAAIVFAAAQVPILRRLRHEGPTPSPPRGMAAG